MDDKTAQHQNPVSQPSVAPAPGQSVKSKPKSTKGVIIAVAVFVLLAVAGAAAYLLKNKLPAKTQNTQTAVEPTAIPASWKTYTNAKYNFSIDYPNEWLLSEPESKNGVSFFSPDKADNPDADNSIALSVHQKLGGEDRNLSFEEYVKIAGKEIENRNGLASIKKVITADGTVGYVTTWMVQGRTINGRPPEGADSESSPITYFEVPGDKTVLLSISLGNDEDLAIYEQMLLTLKFTAPPVVLQPTSVPTPTSNPTPTVDERSVLKTAIKEALVAKHGSSANELTVTVSKIEGNYSSGGASGESGGGMWLAAKVNGIWKIIWDGNGTISCSDFIPYPDFPTSILPECWDEATQDIVKR